MNSYKVEMYEYSDNNTIIDKKGLAYSFLYYEGNGGWLYINGDGDSYNRYDVNLIYESR